MISYRTLNFSKFTSGIPRKIPTFGELLYQSIDQSVTNIKDHTRLCATMALVINLKGSKWVGGKTKYLVVLISLVCVDIDTRCRIGCLFKCNIEFFSYLLFSIRPQKGCLSRLHTNHMDNLIHTCQCIGVTVRPDL